MKKTFALIVAMMWLLAGCATVEDREADRYVDAIVSISALDYKELATGRGGLTEKGCRTFFPGMNPKECQYAWQMRSAQERSDYLRTKASVHLRAAWQFLQEINQQEFLQSLPRDDVKRVNETLVFARKRDLMACSQLAGIHPDHCVLLFSDVMSEEEITIAVRAIEKLKEPTLALGVHHLRMDHVRMHQQLMMRPLRLPPNIRLK